MRPPFSAGSTVLALGIALLSGCGGDGGGGDPGQQQFTRHDGQGPVALIQVTDGNFYGVTAEGGDFGFGSVFRITPEGEELVLYSFAGGPEDGGAPQSLMEATDGNFYGTTSSGGCCGAVFKLTPEGSEAILYFFKGKADGGTPAGGLIEGSDGSLYGIADSGGALNGATGPGGVGVLYRITRAGAESVLYSFRGGTSDGAFPASLMQASDGNFYVTTQEGGTAYAGTIVRISPQGTESVLYSFQGLGVGRVTPLIEAGDGNFYGIAEFERQGGTFYQLTAAGAERVLYDFGSNRSDGFSPQILIRGSGDSFYGFANGGGLLSSCGSGGCGALFQITTAGVEAVTYRFPALTPAPNVTATTYVSALVVGQDGNLYGTTDADGQYSAGTFFRLTAGGVFTTLYSFGAR
jgi:uncharacterized repeat protein (TIGR03803 family)